MSRTHLQTESMYFGLMLKHVKETHKKEKDIPKPKTLMNLITISKNTHHKREAIETILCYPEFKLWFPSNIIKGSGKIQVATPIKIIELLRTEPCSDWHNLPQQKQTQKPESEKKDEWWQVKKGIIGMGSIQ